MGNIFEKLRKVGINNFFFLMIGMIVLARFFPEWGTSSAPLPLKSITGFGIVIIFFFYGVKLNPMKLISDLSNWKLHLVVQLSTFLIFPLIVLILYALFGEPDSYTWLGVFYLAALPSTVSSSVVMVSIAKGNLPAAIFNASISSIIGIFITPVWMEFMLPASSMDFDLTDTFFKLSLQVLLPLLIGLSLHHYLAPWVGRNSKSLKNLDQGIILLIVFTAFAESFAEKMFDGKSALSLFTLGALMVLFFLVMMTVMHFISKGLGFNDEDRIAVLFCGSKKSLVQGAVMGKVMFPDPVIFGVILLPLMMYHALQLLLGTAIAQKMGQRKMKKEDFDLA
ncbi:bile acid:sodium symporter family protein [Belliella kenyensis]|uniref:Bile acid:sodium symporter family protein n=1 Tax=Belliella kenyensis TaxID=1472724 RepID=A0ABV8EKK0_9BACT|nr:bile acid:sodium symporter family protein [Belliella kenyensis]MCH7400494.1 bile acid:sodium symporter [Belliella kenyensis]MDN3604490.1 bile acid:sodium symporter family protein [Belliella kenyensis]